MWQYNNTNELYHYGILGMRWGHRKARPVNTNNNSFLRRRAERMAYRRNKKDESWKNVGRALGGVGVVYSVASNAIRANSQYRTKRFFAHVANAAANAYIANANSSYRMKRGVDFARKAAIAGLSVSALKGFYQAGRNVANTIRGAGETQGKRVISRTKYRMNRAKTPQEKAKAEKAYKRAVALYGKNKR